VSKETVKRALEWLRDCGAQIEYCGRARAWVLKDREFALPLVEPSADDLQAALTAAGLLRELGQQVAADRARALFADLARQISGEKRKPFRVDALRVTQATDVVADSRWMLQLLAAARRHVVRLQYRSPWKDEAVTHELEPWQVWLHNGVLYVRGYSRTRGAERTFRLAHVESVMSLSDTRPAFPVPADPWAGEDPRYGIDEDRPGEAVVRFRGRSARSIAVTRWHPSQHDTWVVNDEVLERRLAYRSCREFARRLAAVADGIETLEPKELRLELVGLLERGVARLCRADPVVGKPADVPNRSPVRSRS
jgi:predicted DNA-binding transcriptional regulator YafY